MPCTPQTYRCAFARDYGHEMEECCREHVRSMVGNLAAMLDEVGARWWADYGTLLGAVRNPMTTWADYPWLPQSGRTTEGPAAGIIPHDKDADLSLLWLDWPKVRQLKQPLQRLGYEVILRGQGGSMKVRLSRRNHTNVDLFFWREKPVSTLYRSRYAVVDECKGKEFPAEWVENLGSVEWEGLTLPAPADPERFLEMRYGPNWRTPVAANHDGVRR